MVLDKEFQEKITSLIDECLIPHGIQTHECKKEFWNFRAEDDFKYGHKAGVIMGIALKTIFFPYMVHLMSTLVFDNIP